MITHTGKKLKRLFRQTIMLGLYGVGTILPTRKVPMIIYHSVDESGSCISIKPSDFESHMKLLKESGYRTITMSEMVSLYKNGASPPSNSVVLTFDDGYRNNYELLFPILKKLGYTATIFLTTDYLNGQCTWDKEPDIPDLPLMSWEMVKEMHEYGIDFQPHTATHPHLPTLSDKEIREEVRTSIKAIEDNLGKKCVLFCYPYGEFDHRAVKILKEESVIAAAAEYPGKEDDYAMRRVGSGYLTTPMAFKAALKGRFSYYINMMAKGRWEKQ